MLGEPWRHLGDAYLQGPLAPKPHVPRPRRRRLRAGQCGHVVVVGGAGYLKIDLCHAWNVAVRGDYLRRVRPCTDLAAGRVGRLGDRDAAPDAPADGVLFRLEARHDQAAADAYFAGDPTTPTRRYQDTVTLGATAWF